MMTDTFTSNPSAPSAADTSSVDREGDTSHADDLAPGEPQIIITQPLPMMVTSSHESHVVVQDDVVQDEIIQDAIAPADEQVDDAAPIESQDEAQAPAVIAPVDPLPYPREPRIIAMINQKGGVGKTTSTVNLGGALSHLGYRVLLIDLDPQAHLTLHVGIDPSTLERSNYDLLTDDDVPASEVMHKISDNLFVLPAEVNLAGAETEMAPKLVTGRAQRVLKDKLAVLMKTGCGVWGVGCGPEDRLPAATTQSESTVSTPHPKPHTPNPGTRPFDYILLDCPPSLGLLTINALSFAKEVFVPMQAHFLALQGLSKLLETVGHIRSGFNAELEVTGVILCMHEKQTLLAAEVSADLNAFLDGSREQDVPWRHATVLTPSIRRNIKLAESPSFGHTIFDYAPDSNGAADYRKLAMSVVKQGVKLGK